MLKSFAITAVVGAIAGNALVSASHVNAEPYLTVNNRTSKSMDRFFATPDWYDKWGADLLGNDVLYSGHQARIDLRSPTDCVFDLKAVMGDGEVLEDENIDVCNYNVWNVHPKFD